MNPTYNEIKQAIVRELERNPDMSDEQFISKIEHLVFSGARHLVVREKMEWIHALYHSFRGLDVLQKLIDDEDISEIMINCHDQIFYEKNGQMNRAAVAFENTEKLEDVIQMIVSKVNRSVNRSSPIVDARWQDSVRVNVVLPPVSLNGPVMTLRKFPKTAWTMERLLQTGFVNDGTAQFLRSAIQSKYNILVGGGTGTGKTTLLNALGNLIGEQERVITIEDTAELKLSNISNLVRLETRNPNSEGKGEILMSDLIRTALRMRPTRIIVGEVRGGEAFDMLQALNTGHDGSMSTIHANRATDMFARLETMVLSRAELPLQAVRNMIVSALELFIHLSVIDGKRQIVEIIELTGIQGEFIHWNPLFTYREETKQLEPTGNQIVNSRKMNWYGR